MGKNLIFLEHYKFLLAFLKDEFTEKGFPTDYNWFGNESGALIYKIVTERMPDLRNFTKSDLTKRIKGFFENKLRTYISLLITINIFVTLIILL